MSEIHSKILDSLNLLFDKVDEALSEWDYSSGNYPIPTLIASVAVKLNISDKSGIRKIDPLIRHYISEHPEWNSKRGSGGGVVPTSSLRAAADAKAAKESAKKEMRAQIEASEIESSEDLDEGDE